MKAPAVFLLCAITTINAQMLNPIPTTGMGSGWGNPMWHSGIRYPGLMHTSQLNSMTYPTWRSHPLFRMISGVSEKNMGSNLPSDVINIPKVPSTQEVLTHMALANPNPKPYFDTISDLLYEPTKTRAVVTSIVPGASMQPLLVTSANAVGPVSPIASPSYLQGMNLLRTGPNLGDDCGPQEKTRWERGMDWLY